MVKKVLENRKIIVLTVVALLVVTVGVNLLTLKVQYVMVVVQAHDDDFDLSLSGQAITRKQGGWAVIIVTVTDVAVGHYNYAVEDNFIEPDAAINSTVEAPDGRSYLRPFYSNNLRDLRLNAMKERYTRRGFISIQPDTLVPDRVLRMPSSIQEVYYDTAESELLKKLNDKLGELRGLSIPLIVPSTRLHILFYVHDPTVCEHEDHVFAGMLGMDLYEGLDIDLGDSELRYYYAYTGEYVLEGYVAVSVSDAYDLKFQLFEEVWQFGEPELRGLMSTWHKNPWSGDDYWFQHELELEVRSDKAYSKHGEFP
jgi:hypothetical protein